MITVLLVEDEPGDAALVGQMLGSDGHRLVHRSRLEPAVGAATDVDVVLLDLGLPGTRGLETLRTWLGHRPDLPVVVLTGADDDELAAQAVAEGAQDFVAKGRMDDALLRRTLRYALERHRATRELARRRDELVTAVAERDEVLAMASHDLRSPLSVLRASSMLLSDRWDAMPRDQRADLLDAVTRTSWQLEEIVQDLLDLARERRLAVRAESEAVRLDQLVTSALDQLDLAGPVDVRGLEPIELVTDASRLRRIVVNLVQNAAKYGRPPIELATAHRDGGIVLMVADHGDGVPHDFRDELFRPFTRARTTDAPGSGLGLAIVDRLAEVLGGRVVYRDRRGGGAQFDVWLPAAVGSVLEAS